MKTGTIGEVIRRVLDCGFVLLPALPHRHPRPSRGGLPGYLLRRLPGKLLVMWDGVPRR